MDVHEGNDACRNDDDDDNNNTTNDMKMSHSTDLDWQYNGVPQQQRSQVEGETIYSYPPLDGPRSIDLGTYSREEVTNSFGIGKQYFDLGLRLMLSYQHELASKCFLACLDYCPNCALAHGFIAICHSPNYNFRGSAYYKSACHYEDVDLHDLLCVFPSEQVAERHSKLGIEKIEELRRLNRQNNQSKKNGGKHSNKKNKGNKNNKSSSTSTQRVTDKTTSENDSDNTESTTTASNGSALISDVECQLLQAIRILTCQPGVDPGLSEEIVGRPYAEAMAKVLANYPNDPDVAYCYAEALMVLNAWELYDYPTGKPRSPDVLTAKNTLESSLAQYPNHAGLCHMYVHLTEMSSNPSLALQSCESLRVRFPHAGHLIHMATHVDVLVGDYVKCYEYNCIARNADLHLMKSYPGIAGTESFYFGYIIHNYHMGIYGAILGGMEKAAMDLALEVNDMVNERMFEEFPDLAAYLEAYSALEVHVMVRFGRWQQLLDLPLPNNPTLMMYRTASIRYGRAIAYAMNGNIKDAMNEAEMFDTIRNNPLAQHRILHNNNVADLLHVDSVMMHGEILYKSGQYTNGLNLLKKAITLQDNLNYDEPWGKMQPIRHAYGGLLYEQGQIDESINVFRTDLKYHPKNPWALVGLITCLQTKIDSNTCTTCSTHGKLHTNMVNSDDKLLMDPNNNNQCKNDSDNEKTDSIRTELKELQDMLHIQRQSQYADYPITVPCECCQKQ